MEKQKTITRELTLSGVGLHTANKVNVKFKPAPVDSGIVFIRTDIPGNPVIKASIETIVPTLRRSCIGDGKIEVQTVEHLMATLSGLSIDNIIVEIDNNELPALDGSSKNFVDILSDVAIAEQEKERVSYSVREPVFIEEVGSSLAVFPSTGFKVSYTLDYRQPLVRTEFFELEVNAESFKKEISAARTFCLEKEINELKSQGVGQGANYENTLVLGENGVIKNKLRYEDEFVRHKILDLIGDLYLIGPIKGHVIAVKSGHSLNIKLAKKILQQKQKNNVAGISSSYKLAEGEPLDINTIMKILPHRHPFLFVDRIIHLEKGRRAVGIKNVTINDYFFKGHFPGKPVMPGVIIVEAMAQVGGVMMLASPENHGKLAFFMAANNIKFRKTVVPGDQLVMEVEAGKIKSKTGQVFAKALVDGKVAAEGELMFALAEY